MDSYTLKLIDIENLIDRAGNYLIYNGAERKEALKTKLILEETLLKYRDKFDEETEIRYHESKVLGQLKVSIYIDGNSYNPFEIKETPGDIIMDSLLASYSNATPNWKYKNFVNQIDFSLSKEKKITLLGKIIRAIIIGVVLGLLARLLPGGIGVTIATDYASPLCGAFAGLFCVMAVFLTFLAISLGIVHAGDLSTINTIGKTMLGRFFRIMGVVSILMTLALLPFAKLSDISESVVSIKSVYDILLSFIPSNPIAPLVEFNTAQIIIVGTMFGFSMLVLGGKAKTLENVFTEANIVAVTCNSFINSSLIHVYVGVNFFCLFAGNNLTELLKYIVMVGIILAAYVLLMLVYTIVACKKLHCGPKVYLKKLMAAFMINLSSASYGASFQTSIETLFENGVDIDYAAMGHNIGGLLFKPAYAILLITGTIMSSIQFGAQLGSSYFVMVFLLSFVLAMSLPTIPGAAVSGFTLMFTQLALPQEALAVVLTLNAILDFVTVAVNGFCLQSEIMIGANKTERIDLSKIENN